MPMPHVIRWMNVEVEVAESLDLQDVEQVTDDIPRWLERLAADDAMQAYAARLQGDLCIRLCDEVESQQLNLAYRQQDKPTNVLSFTADQMPGDVQLLGDLLICMPVVHQEAQAQDKSLHHHLHHLVVHGVLHLLGFDHQTPSQAQQMEALEVQLLSQFDVPNPYL